MSFDNYFNNENSFIGKQERSLSDESEPAFSLTDVSLVKVSVPSLCDEQLFKEAIKRNNNLVLSFSLLGLLFSFFFGAGIVFSLIGFIKALRLKAEKSSTTIRWAINVAIIGIVINMIVICVSAVCFSMTTEV